MNVPMQNMTMLRQDQDVHVIEMWGKITDNSRKSLRTFVPQALHQGTRKLIFDFQNVDSIDCSGVCALVETVVLASRKKIVLDAKNVSPDVLAVLDLTGLGQYFSVHQILQASNREDTALKSFNGRNWSSNRGPLQIEEDIPGSMLNLNVNGRLLQGPLEGFGQLWQKTYSMEINAEGITPADLISEWKVNFGKFWPQGNRIFIPGDQISLGKTGLLDLSMGPGLKLITGMAVMYEDDNSFAFLTPQGHMYAGWISFSAYDHENSIMTQVRALIRASDPVYEMGFRLGFGHAVEDRFWRKTLENLASHFGSKGTVRQDNLLIDSGMQWKWIKNLWYNAAIRTTIYLLLTPFRRLTRLLPNQHERASQKS